MRDQNLEGHLLRWRHRVMQAKQLCYEYEVDDVLRDYLKYKARDHLGSHSGIPACLSVQFMWGTWPICHSDHRYVVCASFPTTENTNINLWSIGSDKPPDTLRWEAWYLLNCLVFFLPQTGQLCRYRTRHVLEWHGRRTSVLSYRHRSDMIESPRSKIILWTQ